MTLGDFLLGMMGRIKGYLEYNKDKDEENNFDWDWQKWQEYLNLIERMQKLISILKIKQKFPFFLGLFIFYNQVLGCTAMQY
jgi:hypothetical protein